jgi:hypothetical protein
MSDWRDEFMRLTTFDNPTQYVTNVKEAGVHLQKIDNPEYLTMHVSAQKVLQTSQKKYQMHLFCAEDTAFKHMVNDAGIWDDDGATKRILDKTHSDQPLLKLIGYIRNRVIQSTDNYDSIFV